VYESIAVVGERGQITIPKTIRKIENIKAKDKVTVKIENKKIVVEKYLSKKQKEELMKEGYKRVAELSLKLEEELRNVGKEADEMLDDY
jgi:AbrB family looped-hinge helix DNA binding protein